MHHLCGTKLQISIKYANFYYNKSWCAFLIIFICADAISTLIL
jgi:hypothetical protein